MGRRRTADPHPFTSEPPPTHAGDLPVVEHILSNGLKLLVLPIPGTSIVVSDLYYPVGSADEPTGKTGLAHFVEHMLFKGSQRFPKGQIDQLTFAAAGEANAETGEDFTHYWFRLPSDQWELPLAIEADRMRNALFDRDEIRAERYVIAEERARDLDAPGSRLDERFQAECFKVHPYGHPILGFPGHLDRLTERDLRRFYDQHYRPDGAVLVVVGDVDPARVLGRVRDYFEPIQATSLKPRPTRSARRPVQNSRHAFRLVEPEGVARALMGWHTVARGHQDGPALSVLADLLCCGRRSRLWSLLVEQERVATQVDADHDSGRLAGQFLVAIETPPSVDVDRLESHIHQEIERLAREGPTEEELARSRIRLETAWRWQQEDLSGLASGLGASALWNNWRDWLAEHRAALDVQGTDIQRVASAYFGSERVTIGWSFPAETGTSSRTLEPTGPTLVQSKAPAEHRSGVTWPGFVVPRPSASLGSFQPTRRCLENGLRLITEVIPGSGVVAVELNLESGQRVEFKPGVAHLTGRMLEEGTTRHTAEELAELVEDAGGVLEVFAKGASLHVRAEDLPLAIELLADLAMRPAFPADAFGWVKQRIALELRSDRDDPAYCADALFRSLVYGSHPYGRDPRGTTRDVSGLSLEDVRAHHERTFRPDNASLVVAGDFDPTPLRKLVRKYFGSWSHSRRPIEIPRLAEPPPFKSVRRTVRKAGEQVHLVIGHLGIRRKHPDHGSLAILDHILGCGPGFTDRLNATIRDELGLAYHVSGGMTDSADVEPGVLRIYVGTNPDQVQLATTAVVEQIQAMHAGEFSDEEVDQARRYLQGSWVFDYQGVARRAERLVELETMGLSLREPLEWPRRLDRITANQVRDAARRHLHPDSLVRVVYGPVSSSTPRRRPR